MKQLVLLTLVLLSIGISAQKVVNPLNSPYYIKGTTEINPSTGEVTLHNIETKGFSFRNSKDVIKSTEKNEKAVFVFDQITAEPEISLIDKRLQLWRQDKYGNWMTDEESGNGITEQRLNKNITIMLVLDCSNSLGDDFVRVKAGAKSFIEKLIYASNSGFVHIGVIGFSSIEKTQVCDIRPLTSKSMTEIVTFINNLQPDNATALYYAMDKATTMLDNYVQKNFKNIPNENYEGSCLLAFTDGIDNATRYPERKIFTYNQAYNDIKNTLNTKKIKDQHIETYVIGARGIDIKSEAQVADFKSNLEGLIPEENNGQFKYLENMIELEATFQEIANGLTQRWQNLSCTAPLTHEGGVCWTLGEIPETTTIKQDEGEVKTVALRHYFAPIVGIGGGVIQDKYAPVDGKKYYGFFNLEIGFDYAYPINKDFSVGGYFIFYNGFHGIKTTPNCYNPGLKIGPLITMGNYSGGGSAFVLGLGYEVGATKGFETKQHRFDIRLGATFLAGHFLGLDISTGYGTQCTLTYGYNFNLLK